MSLLALSHFPVKCCGGAGLGQGENWCAILRLWQMSKLRFAKV